MPAAPPQATNKRNRGRENRNRRPMLEAANAENWTIPPSRPIEEPELMESREDRSRARVGLTDITPSPKRMTSR